MTKLWSFKGDNQLHFVAISYNNGSKDLDLGVKRSLPK